MSATSISRMTGGDPAPAGTAPPKVRHRPSWIVFVVLGSIVCLGMGVWQLARYQEASGTVQNLGYTFMWPFLAGFLVYAYYKYIRLEADEAAADDAAGIDVADEGPAGRGTSTASGGRTVGGEIVDDDEDDTSPTRHRSAGAARRRSATPTEIPADILPVRRPPTAAPVEDEGLHAYNAYLAELARQDVHPGHDPRSARRAAGGSSQEEPDT